MWTKCVFRKSDKELDEESVIAELSNLDNNKIFEIHCTARGTGGKIFDFRINKYNQYEYLIYNYRTMEIEWLNNNGYCEFKEK